MDKGISNVTRRLACLSMILVVWIIVGGPFNTYYLIWNLILAWIPMLFAMIFKKNIGREISRSRNIIVLFSSLIWLLFFPNAVYMVTDYIHLSNDIFYYSNPDHVSYLGKRKRIYNLDSLPWNNFFSISFAVFLGCALSVLSLYIFHSYIEKKGGKRIGWVFVTVVHLLSGYAIYLGRFIRFNSWDMIFKPLSLLKFLFLNVDRVAITFTFYFFLLSLFIYSIFYLFIYVAKTDGKN